MKRIIKSTIVAMTLAIASSTAITAYAEDEIFTKEEIINEYWTERWEKTLPGELNPEASLEYHILEKWLDEQYGHTKYEDEKYTVGDWSRFWSIRNAWQDYHEEYTKYWHMVDDKDTGEFYIESYDPDTDTYGEDVLYTFNFSDGRWNMIDTNGNVADSFDPHGGDGSRAKLKEDSETDFEYNAEGYINGEYQGNANGSGENNPDRSNESTSNNKEHQTNNGSPARAKVTGTTGNKESEENVSSSTNSERNADETTTDEEDSNLGIPFIIGGILIVIISAVCGYVAFKKRKDDNK